VTAWLAHFYTALGAGTALAATIAAFAGDFRGAFLWLGVAFAIDSTDGVLARAVGVKERLPWIDGDTLDNVVDYLTYVFVPVLIMLRAGLLPEPAAPWLGVAVLVASGYGFSRTDAKISTIDYFFTGFPSYWNVVALYMYAWRLAPEVNGIVLAGLVALVFVPIRYVYPSRTRAWRGVTLVLAVSWAIVTGVVVWRLPEVGGVWLPLSLVFPAYYAALSLWLTMRDRAAAR
jgi:phosphatidylcholine synthase